VSIEEEEDHYTHSLGWGFRFHWGHTFFFLAHAAKMTTRPAGPRLSVRLAVNAVFVILFYVGPAVCVDLKKMLRLLLLRHPLMTQRERERCATRTAKNNKRVYLLFWKSIG
jgi:hypothetical protein